MYASNSETCFACSQPFEAVGDFIKCMVCDNPYHVQSCSDLMEPPGKTRSAGFLKSCACPTCKTGASHGGATGSGATSQTFNLAAAFAELSRKLDSLMILTKQVNNIEHLVQTMSDHFDEILRRMTTKVRKFHNFEKCFNGYSARCLMGRCISFKGCCTEIWIPQHTRQKYATGC